MVLYVWRNENTRVGVGGIDDVLCDIKRMVPPTYEKKQNIRLIITKSDNYLE